MGTPPVGSFACEEVLREDGPWELALWLLGPLRNKLPELLLKELPEEREKEEPLLLLLKERLDELREELLL